MVPLSELRRNSCRLAVRLGMKGRTMTDSIPFDWDKYKAGWIPQLRNGREVGAVYPNEFGRESCALIIVKRDGSTATRYANGQAYMYATTHPLDLILLPPRKPDEGFWSDPKKLMVKLGDKHQFRNEDLERVDAGRVVCSCGEVIAVVWSAPAGFTDDFVRDMKILHLLAQIEVSEDAETKP